MISCTGNFMNLQTVIQALKDRVPTLGGRVSGAADFASGLESVVNLLLPAAFVLPLEDAAGDNDVWPGLTQNLTERIGVVVQFDNTTIAPADQRTGFSGVNQVDAARVAVFKAVLNWIPPDQVGLAARGFRYGGGRLVDFDRARLFWQFEFLLDTTITDFDGFPLSGDPIKTAIGTIAPSSVGDLNPPVVTVKYVVP
jgi:hypothetical protein